MNSKRFSTQILVPVIFILISTFLRSQTTGQGGLSPEDISRYKEDATQMISYLQFTFNTLGNPEVTTKEKDIIINQSWVKVFKNEKVQVEDDLDENREVPLNKDVQAYLKDIDFFFKDVVFTFTIQEIEHFVAENNQFYFKITLNRNLKGTLLDGNKVDVNRIRYVEINLDDANKDLKIVSIYTTKLNEREELRRWWSDLPLAWRNVLGENITLKDTLKMKHVLWFNDSVAGINLLISRRINQGAFNLSEHDTLKIALSDTGKISASLIDRQIQKIIQLDTINIAGNKQILSLDPLTKITRIKFLNFSKTAVESLMPVRNLSHLEYLDGSKTLIDDLDPIRYLNKLKVLLLSGTRITDIEPVANFSLLQQLNISQTLVVNLDPVLSLKSLQEIDIAGTGVIHLNSIATLKNIDRLDFSDTKITDLNPIRDLSEIVFLKFENTPVGSLTALSNLKNLSLLFIDQSAVADLSPLDGLPKLTKIYCDKTRVTRNEAVRFMESNPNVLVIYETTELINWWKELPAEWKAVFADKVSNAASPTKEELHDVTRTKELNIAGNAAIVSLEPLANMTMLNSLFCQGTGVADLTPLSQISELRELNFSNTKINDLTPLQNLSKLTRLSFDYTGVTSVIPIMELSELKTVYCDHSPVNQEEIVDFLLKHPACLVIYQTDSLREWWDELPEVWKLIAENYITANSTLSREQLHELTSQRSLDIDANAEMSKRSLEIISLEPLSKMILLENLKFSNTRVISLDPLRGLSRLQTLVCISNPVVSLEPLSNLLSLEVLDIQNTSVKQLVLIGPLRNLKKLNCSGTQIKSLKGVETLENLGQIDCINTRIKNLKPLQNLPRLKQVRCFNTGISAKTIAKFKALRPDVEVVF